MKKIDLLKPFPSYKANLHCHSTLSDGNLTPEDLKTAYMAEGYSIVAYTDHRHYAWHKELTDENFLALAAYEVDMNEWPDRPGGFDRVKTYHLNLYDKQPAMEKEAVLPERRYGDIHYLNQYIENMRQKGFLVCYNHPYWSLQTLDDYRDIRGCFAMEIYNHGCEIDGLYGYNPQVYDEMLRTGNRLYCVSTDDNHNWYPFGHPMCDSFGGFVMIQAPELEYNAVMQALEQGDFYSSMGPEFYEISLEGRTLRIDCSPVQKIYVQTQGRFCHKAVAPVGETLTHAEFELNGNEGYIRVDLRDAQGLHANSNAYFLDEVLPG